MMLTSMVAKIVHRYTDTISVLLINPTHSLKNLTLGTVTTRACFITVNQSMAETVPNPIGKVIRTP